MAMAYFEFLKFLLCAIFIAAPSNGVAVIRPALKVCLIIIYSSTPRTEQQPETIVGNFSEQVAKFS